MTPEWEDQVTGNIILEGDSYGLTHYRMEDGVENESAYFEMRSGGEFAEAVQFGLQAKLLQHLTGLRVTHQHVGQAKRFIEPHMGPGVFNEAGWKRLAQEYHGKLPLKIDALPEGTVVPIGTPYFRVSLCEDDPAISWLVQWVQTILTQVWYPSTVATLSREVKKLYRKYMLETLGSDEGLEFMLHDFGCRGATGMEAAGIGGMGHLVNSKGTDTLPALLAASRYYSADLADLAFSVPASQHAIMTGPDGELAITRKILREYKDSPIVSIVIDSNDPYAFMNDIICGELKDEILAGTTKVVVRPDSPTQIHPLPADQVVWIYDKLWRAFGGTLSPTGYKVLHDKVGVLWGDGLNYDKINSILTALEESGFATTNVSGMGGGLLQAVTRDTQRCAYKTSAKKRNGVWENVQKNTYGKSSKAGIVEDDRFETVFLNGDLVRYYTFDEVRKNAELTN